MKLLEKMRILVGVDGSLQSRKALSEAVGIAKHFSGYLKVVTVHEKGNEEKAKATLADAKRDLERETITYDYELASVVGSTPSRVLVATAKQENFDLIVIGSRGLSSGVSILLGSVSKQVVGNAYCNVLVVKK